jgi:hypothetical protein
MVIHYLTRSRQILLVTLILACVLFPFTYMGCEPNILFHVENQSDSNINVLINGDYIGSVSPAAQETFNIVEIPFRPDVPEAPEDYLIEAKTSEDEILYSERFTWQELHDMNWTVVIPPSAE